ncbi:MAG TPA: tryptophan synthase subunit alpha [Spirochaetota bacterium]|nr:tryptophan synthase subunit alpha [Spirochaetota bacterium]HPI87934.1 tryptophan synthase subunit alpha [Spirochaetota bacterium]HPR47334.1 tryptophan synthase subunit alpha [Spirochaetota bacterium]
MKGIYIVGGYPDRETFKECCIAVADAGFDFIEIGIPFNDPLADGPVIAEAQLEAVRAGVTAETVARDLAELRLPLKTYVMTYANIIYSLGMDRFSALFKDLASGLIIADLPNRMQDVFFGQGLSIPVIPFATLESREDDIEKAAAAGGDFIYFIGLRGITGSQADFSAPEMKQKVDLLRRASSKKIIIGFGVKGPAEAAAALKLGDGYVIGTEAVRRQKDMGEFKKFLNGLGVARS